MGRMRTLRRRLDPDAVVRAKHHQAKQAAIARTHREMEDCLEQFESEVQEIAFNIPDIHNLLFEAEKK